jgi:hypothetical protein
MFCTVSRQLSPLQAVSPTPVYRQEGLSSILTAYATDDLHHRRCVHARQTPGVGRLVMHTLLARMEHPHAGMDGSACAATPQRCGLG